MMARRIRYTLAGVEYAAIRSDGERRVDAVLRSIPRRLGGPSRCYALELHFQQHNDDGDLYHARWFDPTEEIFRDEEVVIP